MNEYLKTFFELIFDNSKSWGRKTSILFSLIFALFIIDGVFNISYNIFNENRLTQLEKVNSLKTYYKNQDFKLKELNKIENDIFSKEHYSEFFERQWNRFDIELDPEQTKEGKNSVSLFWMVISSNTGLIFAIFMMFLLPIFGTKENRQGNYFIGMLASLFFITIIITIITFIAYQIPFFDEQPKLKYLMNFGIQLLFYIPIIRFLIKRK